LGHIPERGGRPSPEDVIPSGTRGKIAQVISSVEEEKGSPHLKRKRLRSRGEKNISTSRGREVKRIYLGKKPAPEKNGFSGPIGKTSTSKGVCRREKRAGFHLYFISI